MKKRSIHIVPHPRLDRGRGGWAVERTVSKRPLSIHRTQAAAERRGRAVAKRDKVELLIHGRDGRIERRDSFGHDPYPPKG